MRALLSVSNKDGIVEFAKALIGLGWEIISTGGTAKALRDAGLTVMDVSEVTDFPEVLDGRVKTLHPKVHGGILAKRDSKAHMDTLDIHRIKPIDLVAVNLYPFEQTVAKPDVSREDAIENIDIGGPAMLRSAAKNYEDVWVVVDPHDYAAVLSVLSGHTEPDDFREHLAMKVFAHTSRYDAAIAAWFREDLG